MKDGLPSLVGSAVWANRTEAARAAGSEYLNVQFGWLPIVSDILKLGEAVRKADKVLKQYERDSGRVVRRKYYFPSTSDTVETVLSTTERAMLGGTKLGGGLLTSGAAGSVVRRRETRRERWFSGAFTYHLPSDYDSRKALADIASKADKLFGIEPTPELIWNLTPWSWAADWFANTGDVIHNLQLFKTGGLVMPYGYMMEKSIVTDTYTITRSGLVDPKAGSEPLVLQTIAKKRVQANPFGFGLTWNGLSSFQASILAALGISRRR
jgi:hypothetical protein